jgi:hypothetical protein
MLLAMFQTEPRRRRRRRLPRKPKLSSTFYNIWALSRSLKENHTVITVLPIVGAFYRAPAAAILRVLPVGTTLTLLAEPDNPYDANAIAVYLKTEDIPQASLEVIELALPDCGLDLPSFVAQEFWHLGYIPKEKAKLIRENNLIGSEPLPAEFHPDPRGKPALTVDLQGA